MGVSITITLSLPPKALSPNARVHWRTKAKAAKRYREAAYVLAIADNNDRPRWPRFGIVLTFHYATKRRRDFDNLVASVKPAIDGLQDAGIIENDSGMEGITVHQCSDRENPRLEITVTPL